MAYRSRPLLGLALLAMATEPASAYLFWAAPAISGAPVKGDEPGIGLPLPGATPAEIKAHLIWNMRSGLNVAALQCQFSPALRTVPNYNDMLAQHGKELGAAYVSLTAYFKRTGGKTWQTALDQYTTRTYNGFSTLYAQLSFCDTAASIGREVLTRRRGDLVKTAEERMREFRNSLIPVGDGGLGIRRIDPVRILPPIDNPKCWDKKGALKLNCQLAMPVYAPRATPPAPVALPYAL